MSLTIPKIQTIKNAYFLAELRKAAQREHNDENYGFYFDKSGNQVLYTIRNDDALLMLRGYGSGRRTLAPFVFAGVGSASRDDDGLDSQQQDWSYGAGIFVPLGSALELFQGVLVVAPHQVLRHVL